MQMMNIGVRIPMQIKMRLEPLGEFNLA